MAVTSPTSRGKSGKTVQTTLYFLVEAFPTIAYIHVVPQTLEKRVEELEKQVAELTGRTNPSGRIKNPWRTYGAFKDDAEFEEAIRLGREYREQQTFEKELAGS